MKDVGIGKRKREDCCVHTRPGPHVNFDSLFIKVWGSGWRAKLYACKHEKEWKQGCRAFVRSAYVALNLGSEPYPGREDPGAPSFTDNEKDVVAIQLPRLMGRDSLWLQDVPAQLEFVVDNQALAGILNSELMVTNEFHLPVVSRIRDACYRLYQHYFSHKAGYFPSHDWRPREFNEAPDTICNMVLRRKSNVESLDLNAVAQRISEGSHIQIFSDGGYCHGAGAAAFVVVLASPGDAVERFLAGYK